MAFEALYKKILNPKWETNYDMCMEWFVDRRGDTASIIYIIEGETNEIDTDKK